MHLAAYALPLAFVGGSNSEGKANPIASGETWELTLICREYVAGDATGGCSRLAPLSQKGAGRPWETVSGDTLMRSPSRPQHFPFWVRDGLTLSALDPALRRAPMADLALAKVTINASGELEDEQTINSVNPIVRSWIESFIHKIGFSAAVRRGPLLPKPRP